MNRIPNDKYGLLRGKPFVNEHRKLLLGIYIGMAIVFFFLFSQCSDFLNYPMFFLIISISNVLFALAKSNELYKVLINERAILNDIETKDFVNEYQVKSKEALLFSVLVYYLNYMVLILSICMITLAFVENEAGIVLWLIIVLGIGVFIFGEFIANNTTSITDKEPEILAIEQYAIEEREKELQAQGKVRKNKDRIEIERKLFELRMVDFFWLLFVVLEVVVWLLNVYNVIGHSYE